MSRCCECVHHWSPVETVCYGTCWGRCTAERERLLVLEAALKDVTVANADACLVFEPVPIEEAIKAVEEEGGR